MMIPCPDGQNLSIDRISVPFTSTLPSRMIFLAVTALSTRIGCPERGGHDTPLTAILGAESHLVRRHGKIVDG
jgi:hypothetical protein